MAGLGGLRRRGKDGGGSKEEQRRGVVVRRTEGGRGRRKEASTTITQSAVGSACTPTMLSVCRPGYAGEGGGRGRQ